MRKQQREKKKKGKLDPELATISQALFLPRLHACAHNICIITFSSRVIVMYTYIYVMYNSIRRCRVVALGAGIRREVKNLGKIFISRPWHVRARMNALLSECSTSARRAGTIDSLSSLLSKLFSFGYIAVLLC